MKKAIVQMDGLIADFSPLWNKLHLGEDFQYPASNPIKRGWIWSELEKYPEVAPDYNQDAVEFCALLQGNGYRIFAITHIEPEHNKRLWRNMPEALQNAVQIIHVTDRQIAQTLKTEGITDPAAAIIMDDEPIQIVADQLGAVIFSVKQNTDTEPIFPIPMNEPMEAAWRVAHTERQTIKRFTANMLGEIP